MRPSRVCSSSRCWPPSFWSSSTSPSGSASGSLLPFFPARGAPAIQSPGAPRAGLFARRRGPPMRVEIGVVASLYRYPVKSMAGEQLTAAALGFHGLLGGRRFAVLREQEAGGFPWLTASRVPSLVAYQPCGDTPGDGAPSRVRTPEGEWLELRGEPLRQRLCAALGGPVRLVQLERG